MHVPLQFSRPVWQVSWHCPIEQTSPPGQMVPHVPQFVLSVCVFVQNAPASVVHVVSSPHETPQLPPAQTSPVPQAFPQPPQLLVSFCSLTHEPLHDVVGGLQ
jgi:hypothetical protein